MPDSDSSQCTMPVAPIFVEIGAGRVFLALRMPLSANIGANDVVLCEESESAVAPSGGCGVCSGSREGEASWRGGGW